ncbi:Uma2 family endonuclease [Streptomyces sp. NPDC020875]|uniref:Uma2 family endonuclease n=1 Tax=Streptomyces sp. NPDC020875 TaxID=3154898 RepID=UPI0033D0F9B1
MTAAMAERFQMSDDGPWDLILETWRELDVPEGWHAEIDGDQITLAPPPHRHHNHITEGVQRALYGGGLPKDLGLYQTLGVQITPLQRLYVPDLVIVPRELTSGASDTKDPVDAGEALLVVEVTSKGNANVDRVRKLRAYAQALVPVYLLIDRFDPDGPASTVLTEPEGGIYTSVQRVPFGEIVQLPEPFDIKIDTTDFPT